MNDVNAGADANSTAPKASDETGAPAGAGQTAAPKAAAPKTAPPETSSFGHDAGGFAAVDAAAGGSTPPVEGGANTGNKDASDSRSNESEDGSRLRASLKAIEDRAQELRAWGADRKEAARDLVEARPLAVVGAAFGVGLLLGLVASRV